MIPATTKPNCRQCVHMLALPGDAHIRCNNHSANVLGHHHGIRNGWYEDPAYKEKVRDAIKKYWANKRAVAIVAS